MEELKREYVIPLRREVNKAPKWRRSKKAISVIKAFLRRHMKAEEIVIANELNHLIWEHGAKNPPGKVSIVALRKEIDGVDKTFVTLSHLEVEKLLPETKTKQKKEKEVKKTEENKEIKEEVKEEKPSENKEEEEKVKEEKEEVKKEVKENDK